VRVTYDVRTHTAMRVTRQRKVVPHISPEPPEWTLAALCQQVGTDIFFGDKGASANVPKRLCMSCEVRAQCLEFAMTCEVADSDEGVVWPLRFGIYGGLTALERSKLARSGWAVGDPTPEVVMRQLTGAAAMARDEAAS
jgi:WhiB family redox-sensing transcriptional regulator